jgi:hypothetical protein
MGGALSRRETDAVTTAKPNKPGMPGGSLHLPGGLCCSDQRMPDALELGSGDAWRIGVIRGIDFARHSVIRWEAACAGWLVAAEGTG